MRRRKLVRSVASGALLSPFVAADATAGTGSGQPGKAPALEPPDPGVEWRTTTSELQEYFDPVAALPDGGFLHGGGFQGSESEWNGYLVKVDGDGDQLWRFEAGDEFDYIATLTTGPEGTTYVGGTLDDDAKCATITADGSLQLSEIDTTATVYQATAVTSNGDVAFAGSTGDGVAIVVRDADLRAQWHGNLDLGDTSASGMTGLDDGGVAVSVYEALESAGSSHLARVSSGGETTWVEQFEVAAIPDDAGTVLRDVTAFDGSLYVAGHAYRDPAEYTQGFVAKVDVDGDRRWLVSPTVNEKPTAFETVAKTVDDELVYGGSVTLENGNSSPAYLHVDASGGIGWSRELTAPGGALYDSTTARGGGVVFSGLGFADGSPRGLSVGLTSRNNPPVARFSTTPAEPTAGIEVTLDATESSDPDGTVSTVAWDVDDDGEFETHGETVTYRFDPGSHDVTVQVIDDDGAIATRTGTVTVQEDSATGEGETDGGSSTSEPPGSTPDSTASGAAETTDAEGAGGTPGFGVLAAVAALGSGAYVRFRGGRNDD